MKRSASSGGVRNDGFQRLALLAVYHLAHLRASARKSKGVGSDSIRANLHAGSDGHRDFRSIHRLDFAVSNYSAPRRVRDLDYRPAPDRCDCDLEIIAMIIMLIATSVLVAASALTVLVAWVAEAVDTLRDPRNRH